LSEEDKIVRVSIYLPEDMRARFKSACALDKKSMNEVLVEFIEEFLDKSALSLGKTNDKGAA
jgi:ParG